MADDKVFSVVDFKAGLDVRKTPLTAPGGSLRILENAVLNQGGEIEKRQAFVYMTQVPGGAAANPVYMVGHSTELHLFGFGAVTVPPGACPVPIVWHQLAPGVEPVARIYDVEPFDDEFFVCGGNDFERSYCWYKEIPVLEADGSPSGGYLARTWKSKMYRVDGKYLRFSGLNNPAQNDPSSVAEPGAGFINLALNDPDGEIALSMEVFYDKMAIMSRLQTQIWTLDPDPTKDTLMQVLRMGIVTPRSMLQFGTGDVLFLSDSGVRSLKATSVTLSAANVSDVGSAIDLLLIPITRNMPIEYFPQTCAVVQPIQGRYWLALGDTIYVLSYFPAGDITAWSTFKPGFTVKCFAVVNNMVFVLDTENRIYLYGGVTRDQFDSCKVTIRTPHMSADAPTRMKRIKSVDVMCQGQWSVSIGMLPNQVEAFELCATIQDNTYGLERIPFAGYGSHIGVHLEHEAPGPATMAALHFNLNEGAVG
jgi:hypothetical protein